MKSCEALCKIIRRMGQTICNDFLEQPHVKWAHTVSANEVATNSNFSVCDSIAKYGVVCDTTIWYPIANLSHLALPP